MSARHHHPRSSGLQVLHPSRDRVRRAERVLLMLLLLLLVRLRLEVLLLLVWLLLLMLRPRVVQVRVGGVPVQGRVVWTCTCHHRATCATPELAPTKPNRRA